MSTTEALLAWVDMFNAGGLLSTLVAFDFAKAVIDNEIALMLKGINRGLEFEMGGSWDDNGRPDTHARAVVIGGGITFPCRPSDYISG